MACENRCSTPQHFLAKFRAVAINRPERSSPTTPTVLSLRPRIKAAHNGALARARIDYAFWLDVDDLIEPRERTML
jgi:hypothetical protein